MATSTKDETERDPFIGDSPLEDPALDRFVRWPFAARVAQTIAQRTDPSNIAVGIYGAWGEGKTTVLNYMRASLNAYEGVVPISFNPWLFRGEEELLFNFFATIADVLGRKLSKRKEEIGETLTKYASLLSPVYRGAGDAARGIGSALSNVDITDYRDRLESILKEEGKRLVIFIDDIDRFDKAEIQSVFRLVKLSADFQYTAYVLAFDADMVAAALKERYVGSKERAGHSFLEKIIQVPLNLPPANHASLEKMCFEGIDEALRLAGLEIEESQVHEYWRAFYDGLTIRLTTPRAAKRYVNAVSFALPIRDNGSGRELRIHCLYYFVW